MKRKIAAVFMLTVFLSVLPTGHSALADMEFKELSNVMDSVRFGLDQYFFYRVDTNPFYGADVWPDDDDTAYGEIMSIVRLTAEKNIGWTTLSGQFALAYMSTIDEDMFGAHKDESDLDVNQAWLKFGALLNSPFDLTVGRQDIQIEKQFLIGIGQGQPAAFWILANKSFPFAVRLEGDFGNLKTDTFWARSQDYWQTFMGNVQDQEVAGMNIHYDFSEEIFVYGGYFQKIDDSDTTDDQTRNYDIGAQATLGNFLLEGEFVYQNGDSGTNMVALDREAMGYYASAKYTLPTQMAPYISATYFHFSGDDDPSDGDNEDFDPMFYGTIGWNKFFIGEIAGEIHLTNSNRKVWAIETGFMPTPSTQVSLTYLKMELDAAHYLGHPVTSEDWSDEFNLFVDYFPNQHLYIHLGLGYSIPDDAAEEAIGGDSADFFTHVMLGFHI